MPTIRRDLLAATALTLPAILAALAVPAPARANPEGGAVAGGQVAISAPDAGTLRIDQGSQNAIINWQRFDIGQGEAVEIRQPSASAALLNRVTGGGGASRLLGRLSANGQVMLVNPNGVMIGRDAVIDVGALVATTADIPDAAFMAGSRSFGIPGNPNAAVINAGAITAREGGLVALVAPGVANSGVISARLGRVALASGDTAVLDFYGDGLVEVAADAAVLRSVVDGDGNPVAAAVENRGHLLADGGRVWLTAALGAEVLDRAINVEGLVQADSISAQAGEIVLNAAGAGAVEIGGTVQARGMDAGGAGGRIRIAGGRVIQRGPVDVSGTAAGGSVAVAADGLLAVGNRITADGGTGGAVQLAAGMLSSAGEVTARGTAGAGGAIDIATAGSVIETSSGSHDASGASDGGRIRLLAGRQMTTSGHYRAEGEAGRGGRIELSAPAVKLLSPRLSASGAAGGGILRLGGEFQGGKHLAEDELPNARSLVATDATALSAAATGTAGEGGTVVLWSDEATVFLGSIDVRPGSQAGAGGLAEISSGGLLTWRGQVATGRGGRPGRVLLDPKNITIAEPGYSQYSLILGYNYSDLLPKAQLDSLDLFGTSVALDGTRLAVGAPGDDGADNATSGAGAVYLFTFADTAFSGGELKGVIGRGHAGGSNLDLALLGAEDGFGTSVALDGTSLAVGAPGDDGFAGTVNDDFGAVYTFGFGDANFGGGSLVGRIGNGYTGTDDLNLALDIGDEFGHGVALDGTRLAVGAPGDAGSIDGLAGGGAVYLFSTSAGLAAPVQEALVGHGYTGGKDHFVAGIGGNDHFGTSVALDGTRLAVGAVGDDGFGNTETDAGAVYLVTFTDTAFNGAAVAGIVGEGYVGAGEIAVNLDPGDAFGSSVSLGTQRLLAGAPKDDGHLASGASDYGAVYDFSFTDAAFSGGTQEGIAGKTYIGVGSVNLALQLGGRFGTGVALDGSRWAAGSPGDSGAVDPQTDTGAVRLFTAFPGTVAATIGRNYADEDDIDLSRLPAAGDGFGAGVSLDGTRLAVGAPFDDGAGDQGGAANVGAVYLFDFADSAFNGGALKAVLGYGHVGGRNLDVAGIGADDHFGAALSLDGTKLAVGAPGDDGAADTVADAGAVYLFTFADLQFSGGAAQQTIARKAVEVLSDDNVTTLESSDGFGGDVSLDDGRLAVGAADDDGPGNVSANSGAVYLFGLSADLGTVTAIATLGDGYSSGNDIHVPGVEAGDRFGSAVALDGLRLAVGASSTPDTLNSGSNRGAVHLFTFAASGLTGGSHTGIIADGDASAFGQSYDVTSLENDDYFGESLALDGDELAVGAPLDDGYGNGSANSGAVYLFDFADNAFTAPTLRATIGSGYAGGANVSVSLSAGDMFGDAVSLDGGRLAVGATYGDGSAAAAADSGAVYLFDLSGGAVGDLAFAADAGSNVTVSAPHLAELLATPQDVVLQANNDITVSAAISVANPAGNGGSLTLEAGRSILLNAGIVTDNGDFTAIGNSASAAVLDSQRDPGAAAIAMTDGIAIDAGTGHVALRLDDGGARTKVSTGDITVAAISAGSVSIANKGVTAGSDILSAGSTPAIDADAVALSATAGIGQAGQRLRLNADRLELSAAQDAYLYAGQALQIGGVDSQLSGAATGGVLNLEVAGALSQTEAVATGGALTIASAPAGIALTDSANDFQGPVSLNSSAGAVAIATGGSLTLGQTTVSGSFAATAGGGIGQSGVLTFGGTAGFTAQGGAIALNDGGNSFAGAVSLTTVAAHAASIAGTGSLTLGAVDIGGDLNVAGGGAAVLTADVTAGGDLSLANGAVAGSDVDIVSEGGALTLGPVSHGGHAILLAADSMDLTGNWSGTGTRTILPYSASRNVRIATAGAPGTALELSAAEIARLEHDSPAMVTIGRNDGSGALSTGSWSFDDNLTLRGSSIALGFATLTKSAGSLALAATGAVTGAVNLAAGTGILSVQGASVQLSGTVNGISGAAAADQIQYSGSGGGPFTINGATFHTPASVPADPGPDQPGGDGGGDGGDIVTAPGEDAGSPASPAAPVEDIAGGTTAPAAPGAGTGANPAGGAAAGFGTSQGEAVETAGQVATVLAQSAAAKATAHSLTVAAFDTATGLSGSGDGGGRDGGGKDGGGRGGGSTKSGGQLTEEQPFDESSEEEAAADDEREGDDQAEDEQAEEEQQPARTSGGYGSNRYVEVVDPEAAAASQDTDDGGAGAGAGCAC